MSNTNNSVRPMPNFFELPPPIGESGETKGPGMIVVGPNADVQFRDDRGEKVGDPGPKLLDVAIVEVPTDDGGVKLEAHTLESLEPHPPIDPEK